MKTISFITQKGGAGKTTLVLSSAVVAQNTRNKVLIVDTDPQKTATEWYKDRPEDKDTPQLVAIDPKRLPEAISKAEKGSFDFVLIDTAGRDLPSTKKVIALSDLIVIPCRPAIGDMRASVASVQAISEASKPYAFVVNQSPFQLKRAKEAIKSLKALGTVCPVPVVARAVYQDAQAEGLGVSEYEPDGKAHQDI